MPRFVLLKHTMPPEAPRETHWDFMLEAGGSLHVWALEDLPSSDRVIAATRLADHRSAYLDFEGPISGNRGCVARVDRGEYAIQHDTADRIEVALMGDVLRGRVTLRRTREDQRWSFSWRADAD